MKIVIVRDITPLDGQTCNSTCVWWDGQQCSLFLTALAPLSNGLFETRCRRSRECREAERRGKWLAERHVGMSSQINLAAKGAA
jgi:hypothetical protein